MSGGGFRVPTITELRTETLDNGVVDRNTAFANFLKLPSAGLRSRSNGGMRNLDSWGYVWSSSASNTLSIFLYFSDTGNAGFGYDKRAYGLSVRCLKDEILPLSFLFF